MFYMIIQQISVTRDATREESNEGNVTMKVSLKEKNNVGQLKKYFFFSSLP